MRRFVPSILLALGLAAVTAVPVAAKDTYAFFGPLEIQIVGAGGDLRQFIAFSADDRRGVNVLVAQVVNAIAEQTPAGEPAAPTLPHYRIGVSHLGMSAPTMPWSRSSPMSFLYYPGGGTGFLRAEFSAGGHALEARWIRLRPEVAAMIQRHLNGLAPIGADESPQPQAGLTPWAMASGAVLLAIFTAMLWEDRRRWRLVRNGAPAKGTHRRS